MKIVAFFFRLLLSTIVIGTLFVFTQDFQVMPALMTTWGTPPAVRRLDLPAGVDDYFVQTVDGELLEAWRLRAEESRGTVLLFHGNADTLHGSYGLQRWIRDRGLTSWAFHYRGVGASTGWPTEVGLMHDTDAVIAKILEIDKVDLSQLLLLGFSFGAGPAAYGAYRHSPGAVVLLAPFERFRTLVEEMPLVGYLAPFLKYDFPVGDYLASSARTKLLLAHGTDDTVIPFAHSERLHKRLTAIHDITFLMAEETGHNDLFPSIAKDLGSFFDAFPAKRQETQPQAGDQAPPTP